MGVFNTSKLIQGAPSLIPVMAERMKNYFSADGYTVESTSLVSGGYEVSITKGGMFKAILGMKTALKICMTPRGNAVFLDASVGIWGKQVIPFAIAMFVTWPVLLTQIWGLIQQSKLDDKAIEIAEAVARENHGVNNAFCPNCGHPVSNTTKFCPECGTRL